jgi:hypothetical protein
MSSPVSPFEGTSNDSALFHQKQKSGESTEGTSIHSIPPSHGLLPAVPTSQSMQITHVPNLGAESAHAVRTEQQVEADKVLSFNCFTTEASRTFDPISEEWTAENEISDVHSWSLKFVDLAGGRFALRLTGKIGDDNRSWESTAIRTSVAKDMVLCKSGSVYRVKPPFLPFSNTRDPVPEQIRQILKTTGFPSNWQQFHRFIKEQRAEEKENDVGDDSDDHVPKPAQPSSSRAYIPSRVQRINRDDEFFLHRNDGVELAATNDSVANSPSKRFLPGPPKRHENAKNASKSRIGVEYVTEVPEVESPDDNYEADPDFAGPAFAFPRPRTRSGKSQAKGTSKEAPKDISKDTLKGTSKAKRKKKPTRFNDSAEFHAEMELLTQIGVKRLPLTTLPAPFIPSSRTTSTKQRKPAANGSNTTSSPELAGNVATRDPNQITDPEIIVPVDSEVVTTRYGRYVVKPSGDVGRSRKVLDADGNFLGIKSALPAFDQFSAPSVPLFSSQPAPPRRSSRTRKSSSQGYSSSDMLSQELSFSNDEEEDFDILDAMDAAANHSHRTRRRNHDSDEDYHSSSSSTSSRLLRSSKPMRATAPAANLAPIRKKPKLAESEDHPTPPSYRPSNGLSAISKFVLDEEAAYHDSDGESNFEHAAQRLSHDHSGISMDVDTLSQSKPFQSVKSRYAQLEEDDEIERILEAVTGPISNHDSHSSFAIPSAIPTTNASRSTSRSEKSASKSQKMGNSSRRGNTTEESSLLDLAGESQSRLKSVDQSVAPSEATEQSLTESTFERKLDDLMREPEPTVVRPVSNRPARAKASQAVKTATLPTTSNSSSATPGEAAIHEAEGGIWTPAQLAQLDRALIGSDPSSIHYLSDIAKLVPGKTGDQILKQITHLKEVKIAAGDLPEPSVAPKVSKSKAKQAAPPSPLTVDADMRKKKNRKKLEAAEAELLKTASDDAFDDPKFRKVHGLASPPPSVAPAASSSSLKDQSLSDSPYDSPNESLDENSTDSENSSFLGSIRSSRSAVDIYRQRLTQESKAKLKITAGATKRTGKANQAKKASSHSAPGADKRAMKARLEKGTKLLRSLETATKSTREAQDELDEIDLEGGIAANFDDY